MKPGDGRVPGAVWYEKYTRLADNSLRIEPATDEVRQLRDECRRLAPIWADYSCNVTIHGVVVRCHPCDVDTLIESGGKEWKDENLRDNTEHDAVEPTEG
jgi:hypothetical protein